MKKLLIRLKDILLGLVIIAVGVWIWPNGVTQVPLSQLTIGDLINMAIAGVAILGGLSIIAGGDLLELKEDIFGKKKIH